MHRLDGVEHDGARPRRCEDRAHLLCYRQVLADAGDDDDALALHASEHQLYRPGEAFAERVARAAQAFDFDVEDLAGALEHVVWRHEAPLLLCLALEQRHADRADDVLGGASAGKVVHRLRESLEVRTDGRRAADALRDLVADVSGL